MSCCGDSHSQRGQKISVELEVCDEGLIDDDVKLLEDAFVSTYNGMTFDYCDAPYFRTLDTAEVLEQGKLTADGYLPVEIEVKGKCRGCDPDKLEDLTITPVARKALKESPR